MSNLSFKKTNNSSYLVSNAQMSIFKDNTFIGTFGALKPLFVIVMISQMKFFTLN